MFDHLQTDTYTLRLAAENDLAAVKQLDDLAFGVHKGISLEELQQIVVHGAVILLFTADGQLIGESQVLLSPVDFLPYELSSDEAFYYGTARHPHMRKQGIGAILAEAQDCFARSMGKQQATLTVRVENLASLQLRLKRGFLIHTYLPAFYPGEAGTGARLVLTKRLDVAVEPAFTNITETAVSFVDEQIDLLVHDRIRGLLANGYVGYAVDASHIYWGKPVG